MESIWKKTIEEAGESISDKEKSLTGDVHTEAAVVGAGLAGILTAWFLQSHGVKTVVLEAETVGSGQTQNTTAKITSQHGLIYHKLLETLGREKAVSYARANQNAITEYERIIREQNITCFFEKRPAYLYTRENGEMRENLLKEAQAAKSLGLPASFTQKPAKPEDLPFSIAGAVRFEEQAQFHPLKFLHALTKNLTIYEHTRVLEAEAHCLVTKQGRVFADHIVFAGHYPFLLRPGYYFLRMHQERSYCLALKNEMALSGMYLGVDEDGLSFRDFQDMTILGGGKHRTGENKSGGKYEMLRRKAEEFWPDSREYAHWSAQDCMTLDGVPYIGRFSADTPNWYVATGFGKWGMTSSMVAAGLISQGILGRESEEEEVFSPQRFTPSASASSFITDGVHAAKDLGRRVFQKPEISLEELPAGHGGIVEVDGQKAGAYRDEDGELYVVSIKCPHLGCQLEWNPDEKSWDCPCHGSRFDYRGRLLDGPAENGVDMPEELC